MPDALTTLRDGKGSFCLEEVVSGHTKRAQFTPGTLTLPPSIPENVHFALKVLTALNAGGKFDRADNLNISYSDEINAAHPTQVDLALLQGDAEFYVLVRSGYTPSTRGLVEYYARFLIGLNKTGKDFYANLWKNSPGHNPYPFIHSFGKVSVKELPSSEGSINESGVAVDFTTKLRDLINSIEDAAVFNCSIGSAYKGDNPLIIMYMPQIDLHPSRLGFNLNELKKKLAALEDYALKS